MPLSTRPCPPAGMKVRFEPTRASLDTYGARHRMLLPEPGAVGTTVEAAIPGGHKTCKRGPDGGLVFVRWPDGISIGVGAGDLVPANGGLSGAARRWRPPKTKKRRRALAGRCGAKCFLLPKKLGFPICDASCKPSCAGLRAAFARARQTHRPAVARKAVAKACRLGCEWTVRHARCER